MRVEELEHLVRAAAEMTGRYEFVIVGSQAILGSHPNAPAVFTMSNEADMYVFNDDNVDDLSTELEGSLGDGSAFHETHGFYAQGVDPTTAKLPSSWQSRVTRLQSRGTNGRVAYCISPVDLFLSKCAANRDKDREFNIALLEHGYVTAAEAASLVHEMPIDEAWRSRITLLIGRLVQAVDGRAQDASPAQPSVAGDAAPKPPRKPRP